mgnify:CR=1 FL=1
MESLLRGLSPVPPAALSPVATSVLTNAVPVGIDGNGFGGGICANTTCRAVEGPVTIAFGIVVPGWNGAAARP